MKKTAIKILVILSFLAAPCAAEVIIVDQQWPYDFNNIQAAIDYSSNGDYIFVFPGTYTGPGNRDIDFLGKAITVRSIFPDDPCIVAATVIDCNGTEDEPHNGFIFDSNEDANSVIEGLTIIRAHPEAVLCEYGSPKIADCSIIVFDIPSRGIYCFGQSSPVITACTIAGYWFSDSGIFCGPNSTPKIADCAISKCNVGISCVESSPEITNCTIMSYHFGIRCSQSTSLISYCNITGSPESDLTRSGISCTGGSSTIISCIISNHNSSGIYCSESNSVITGCTISNNDESGICCIDSNAVITSCAIMNNTAEDGGGGIYCEDSNATITGCTISDNISTGGSGGGICCINSNIPVITDCNITGNSAEDYGGGIYNCNGPINNCTISGNSASAGGGLCGCDGPINNCTIAGNSSEGNGGGLYLCSGPITDCIIANNSADGRGGGLCGCDGLISNCIISRNSSDRGGGLSCGLGDVIKNCTITGNSAAEYGGALEFEMSQVINCTIVGNSAGLDGGAIYDFDGICTNSIIRDNRPGQIENVSFPDAVTYNNIELGWLALGNIDADPCFVEPGYWDANDSWVDGDYHLKSAGWSWDIAHSRWTYDDVTSRCIDAGNPGSPLTDEPLSIYEDPNNEWGQNLRINMGAFGRTPQASIPPYDWALLSDITNDGISDFNDIEAFSSLWLNTGQQLYADFNRDGDVDFFDFALLAQDWLLQTSWY